MAFKNRGKVIGDGFKNRGSVLAGGSFTNRGAQDTNNREFKNRGQAWFSGAFKNRGQTLLESNLVTNGTFDVDTDWTKGTGWSISGGVASRTATGTITNLQQENTLNNLVNGSTYSGSFDVVVSAGIVSAFLGATWIADYSTSGSKTFSGVYGTNIYGIVFSANAAFAGNIDNVVVRSS